MINHTTISNPKFPVAARRDVKRPWEPLTISCRGNNVPIALSLRRIDHRRVTPSAHRIPELFGTHRYNNDPASLPPCFPRLPFLVSAVPNCTPVCHHLYYVASQSVVTIWTCAGDIYRVTLIAFSINSFVNFVSYVVNLPISLIQEVSFTLPTGTGDYI